MTGSGRSRSSDDGAGGVPPFYWVSTSSGTNSYDGSPGNGAQYDSAQYESAHDDSADARYAPEYDAGHDGYYDARYDVVDTPGYAASAYDSTHYDAGRYDTSRYDTGHYDTTGFEAVRDVPTWATPSAQGPWAGGEFATGGLRRVSGLLDRDYDDEPSPADWWRHRPDHGDDVPPSLGPREPRWTGQHPSAPVPGPPPPMPSGAWDRLQARAGGPDDGATEAHPLTPEIERRPAARSPEPADDETGGLPLDWDDHTGGLEVIGAHIDEEPRGGRWRRRRGRPQPAPADDDLRDDDLSDDDGDHVDDYHADFAEELHEDFHGDFHGDHDEDLHDEVFDDGSYDLHGDLHPDDDIPLQPYDPRASGRRRRRRPISLLISLLVLGGVVAGIVFGGQKLLGMINPSSQDYSGQGTGSVEIRVQNGDTLSDIARTLVDADVIASVGPFVDASEAHPEATSIQPGVYGMRQQMSGKAALDLLLQPGTRLVSRITIREGLTVKTTLDQLAKATGTPIAQLQAAAKNPTALGLPAWARGNLEGLLFPATYDFEPKTPPADMLRAMVTRAIQALDQLNVPTARRPSLLTEASIVQAEAASTEDMAKVATVLNNRIADRMPLQLDTTVNYANGKTGLTTTPQDRANPSPYNTYQHLGLPPGPISNPGEDALRAVLHPTPGDWRFFVVVNPDTGETRFARTAEEHQQNVLLFQQWLREHPGG